VFQRTALWLLVTVVVAQVLLIAGRGIGCLSRGQPCSADDFKLAMEQLAGLTGTVIALVMASRDKKD
jgi:hypothetical protein